MTSAAANALLFHVRRPASIYLRRWQQRVNLAIIAGYLKAFRAAPVLRPDVAEQMGQITSLPMLGEAEPQGGMNGGVYSYTFHPHDRGCHLEVRAGAVIFAWAKIDPLPPFAIDLPTRVAPTSVKAPQFGHAWSDPHITTGETDIHEVSGDVLVFPIDGMLYTRLVAWGWDAQQVDAYQYMFQPLTVGCEMGATHLASGREVHLTAGAGW